MTEDLKAILTKMWDVLQNEASSLLPKILVGTAVLLAGLIVARLIRALTARFFLAIRLDRISERLGVSAFLARGDIRHTFAEILATIVYWLVLLFSLQLLGLALGLEGIASFFAQILAYVPRIVIAMVIFAAGVGIGFFFGSAVQIAASNAGFPAAKPLGATVKTLISFFALVMALQELKIETELLVSTMQIVIAAVAFALALAFGLGCKDLAGAAVRSWLGKDPKPQAEAPHPDRASPPAEAPR